MYISLSDSRIAGFLKWSAVHQPDNDDDDDDDSGGATPIALVRPPPDRDAPDDQPHRPWAIPGVGGAF